MYSEKVTKFCEIFTLLLTVCTVVKSKVNISQNLVAFQEYMNFTYENVLLHGVLVLPDKSAFSLIFSCLK